MKYIAFYDTKDFENEKRRVALCAANLTDYILDVLTDFNTVEIISPSRTRNKSGFYKGRTSEVSPGITLTQPPTFGVRTKIGRAVAIAYTLLWLIIYLLIHTKKGETVMVYHSLSTMMPVKLIKKIKKVKLILEIREFYSDARQCYDEFNKSTDKTHQKEVRYFSIADKYVFPTEILNRIVNTDNKPYVISPGIYKSEKRLASKAWDDGKTHIVYAGTLRQSKGVFHAIDVAEFLDKKYCVHILGGGRAENIEEVKKEVERIKRLTETNIVFEGQLSGDEFKAFLQKCQIGLSPQSSDAAFNDTSFPSKIFTYFANGLDVVSVRIPTIETSPVGEYIHYYKSDSVEDLARVIREVSKKPKVNKTELLDRLDSQLRSDLKKLVLQ